MNTTLVFGAGNDELSSVERPISSKISLEQLAGVDKFNGKVEVYDFNISARIPTINKGSYLIYSIMGKERGALIVSPTGGLAVSEYFKPVADLKRDTGQSGAFSGKGANERKSTEEDTERYWLLNNEGFRNDLVAAGWSIFPEVQTMSENEQKTFGLNVSDRAHKRVFGLNDFIRALKFVSSPNDVDYSCQIADLQELTQFGDKMEYCWQNNSGDSFFSLSGKFKDKGILLKLGGVHDVFPDRNNYVPGTTLSRSVPIDSGLSEMHDDLHCLVNEYAEQNGIHARFGYMGNRGQIIHVKDRKFEEHTMRVDTPTLLDQARSLEDFIKNMMQRESRLVEEQRVSILKRARSELGLLAK